MGESKMTIDKLIDICEKQYKRGLATAKSSKYDDGYATAFKLCLTFAKELREEYQALGTPSELAELVRAKEEGRLVEVARCKDCKYLIKYTTSRLWCAYYSDGEYQKEVYNDDFCSYGEPAGKEQNDE